MSRADTTDMRAARALSRRDRAWLAAGIIFAAIDVFAVAAVEGLL